MCRVLLEQPDLLLLDEPTNHLDAESVVWLEKHLETFPGTVVAVTHDRYFLDNSRAYVSGFGFRGADQQKLVANLSGGERNRLHLAKMVMAGGNLLRLDEPTNDLDVDTLRVLEVALLDFAGCAVIISHDRWFLDRVATQMVAFEGESEVVWFEGNYQGHIEDLTRPKVPDADQPHRIKYRKLVRT